MTARHMVLTPLRESAVAVWGQLCARCHQPGQHLQPAFRGEQAFYTCEAAGLPAATGGWRKAPHPADTGCSWCREGYLRLTDGSRVLHSLPEPAGMLECDDPRVVVDKGE